MTCIECNQHLNDCTCPDIEDRLRTVIATGNAFASGAAKRGLMERLSAQRISQSVNTSQSPSVPTLTMSGAITTYAIYEHPDDYPDRFVVRRWNSANGRCWPEPDCRVAATLEEARKLVPGPAVNLGREHEDDAKIVEVWMK